MRSESTAINDLIDLARRKPLESDSTEDLLFEAPKAERLTTTPPRALFPVELPSEPTEARATMPVISTRRQVFEPTPRSDDSAATLYVARHVPFDQALKKLAMPMVGLVVAGLAIGGVVAMTRHHDTHVHAPFAAAALPIVKAAPAPVITPAAAPPIAKPRLVAIRLDSAPPGASATLVDNGTSTPLGSTPVDAEVDPSKSYDVVFSLEGRTTKTEHLDPTATHHLEVALAEPTVPPAPAVVAKAPAKKPPAKPPAHHRRHAKQAARVATATPHPAVPHAPVAKKAAAPATGNGRLMVETTVPCAILIDGKNTGLTSPQAAIALPPGSHQVRLIAAGEHINKLVAIEIVPSHTTKITQ